MEQNKGNLNENQKLADYVKRNITKGYDTDTLKYALLSQGYSRTSVERSIQLAQKQLTEAKPLKKQEDEKPKTQLYDVDEEGYADMSDRVSLEKTPTFFGRILRKFKKKY